MNLFIHQNLIPGIQNIDLKKIVKLLLVTTIAIIPMVIYKKFYFYSEFPKMIALYILTPLLFLLLNFIPSVKQKNGNMNVFIFTYLTWLFINCIFSLDPLTSFLGYYSFFDGFLLYFFSMAFFFLGDRFQEEKRSILTVLIISSTIISIWGIIEFWNGLDRIISTLGQPVNLANFLALIAPCLVGLILSENYKISLRSFLYISLGLITIAQILTFSRAGWYGQILIYILLFAFLGKKQFLEKRRIIAIIITVILVSIVLSYLLVIFQPRHSLLESTRLNQMNQLSMPRIKVIKAAWDVFLQYPLGAGLSTFNFTATKYLPTGIDQSIWANAHNDFFNTLASQGIVGSIFYIVLILLLLKMWWNWRGNTSREGLTAGLWAAVIGHLLMIQSSFPANGYTYLFWFFIGFLNNSSTVEDNNILKKLKLNNFRGTFGMKLLWSVILLVSLGYSFYYVYADMLFVQAQRLQSQGKLVASSNLINKSVKLAPWVELYKLYQIQYDLRVFKEVKLSPDKKTKFYNHLKQELFTLNSLNPMNHRYKEALGNTMSEMGSYSTALVFYQQALELFPNNFKHYDEIGYTLIKLNKFNEAEKYFKKSLEIFPEGSYAEECLHFIKEGEKENHK